MSPHWIHSGAKSGEETSEIFIIASKADDDTDVQLWKMKLIGDISSSIVYFICGQQLTHLIPETVTSENLQYLYFILQFLNVHI